MAEAVTMLDDFESLVPNGLMDESGSVFYSGREAFDRPSDLYILGLNPAGRVKDHADDTIMAHLLGLGQKPDNWSAYRDDPCEGAAPGTKPMQRRTLHLFKRIGRDPGLVPASNVIFKRSSRESTLEGDVRDLAPLCWPFHHAVIDTLRVRVIVCLNGTAARWVRRQVRAHAQVDEFTESNKRCWQSCTYRAASGLTVVALSAPSIADWTCPATDPTHLVKRALRRIAK